MPQTTLCAVFKPCDGGPRRSRRTGNQMLRQRFGQWIAEEKSADVILAAVSLQRQLKPKLLIEFAKIPGSAKEKRTTAIRRRLSRQRFQSDFRPNAGDIPQ